jgi:hypothetical protein
MPNYRMCVFFFKVTVQPSHEIIHIIIWGNKVNKIKYKAINFNWKN